MSERVCQTPPFHYSNYNERALGEDEHGAEVSIATCMHCGTSWLRYFVEYPSFSRSGRWWKVAMSPEQATAISPHSAKAFIEAQSEAFVGGSYFNSTGFKEQAPVEVDLRP